MKQILRDTVLVGRLSTVPQVADLRGEELILWVAHGGPWIAVLVEHTATVDGGELGQAGGAAGQLMGDGSRETCTDPSLCWERD